MLLKANDSDTVSIHAAVDSKSLQRNLISPATFDYFRIQYSSKSDEAGYAHNIVGRRRID